MLVLYGITVGCGFFENDGDRIRIPVTGNFYVTQQENTDTYQLVFDETPEMSTVIVEECGKVLYDPTAKRILATRPVTDNYFLYVVVSIRDADADTALEAYSRTETDRKAFEKWAASPTVKTIFK